MFNHLTIHLKYFAWYYVCKSVSDSKDFIISNWEKMYECAKELPSKKSPVENSQAQLTPMPIDKKE